MLDDRSRQLAQEILAIDPNSPQVLEMLAVAAISDGDAAAAITLLNRTLSSEQRPERVRATVDAIGALRSAHAQQGGSAAIQVNVQAAQETDPNSWSLSWRDRLAADALRRGSPPQLVASVLC